MRGTPPAFWILIVTCATPAFGADFTSHDHVPALQRHLIRLFVEGGAPRNLDSDRPVTVLLNQGYVVGYCEARMNPVWSAYHVDKVLAYQGNQRVDLEIKHDRPVPFYTDERTASKVDGAKTFKGFDRGHMTPNNAIQREFGRVAQMETFLMSNICPQVHKLNSGLWRDLEHRITDDLIEDRDDLWIIAGPNFSENPPHVEGTNVHVPAGFYMLIADRYYHPDLHRDTYHVIAFAFPNEGAALEGKSLSDFVKTVDQIEDLTKLDFFSELNDAEEGDLESSAADFDTWFANE